MRAEVLVGQGTGAASSGVLCVGPCVSLRVHAVIETSATGPLVIKQGETNVSADLKSVQTLTNPVAGGDAWITLQPSEWIEITTNFSAGAVKKVVIAWVPEND